MPVMSDGFSFLRAIDLVFFCDYDEVLIVDHMPNNILHTLWPMLIITNSSVQAT